MTIRSGQRRRLPNSGTADLAGSGRHETWSAAASDQRFSRLEKAPHRHGPFKDAFRNRYDLRRRYEGDARRGKGVEQWPGRDSTPKTFWYRGNGSVDLVADTEFLEP